MQFEYIKIYWNDNKVVHNRLKLRAVKPEGGYELCKQAKYTNNRIQTSWCI